MKAPRLRLIAGELGGRRIQAAAGSRPTQERVREALFSRWRPFVEGAFFLDLFCGGGAVGLEALSRGAGHALFVEADGRRLETALRNAKALGVSGRCTFQRAKLPEQWQEVSERVRTSEQLLLFADPPYDFEGYGALAERMHELDGIRALAIEHSVRSECAVPWGSPVRREYGESALTLWELWEPWAPRS